MVEKDLYQKSLNLMKKKIENDGYLLKEDINILLDLIDNNKLKLLTYTLLYSGRRVSECLLLKPKNIYEDINEIDWAIFKKKDTKNIVYKKKACYPGLIESLISYIVKNNIHWDDYIFSSPQNIKDKKHYSRQNIWYVIHKAGLKMGKNIHPHTLRHTYGIMLAMDGASFKTIQNQLDHENPSTTQIYLDIGQVHIKEDLKKMERKVLK